MTNINPLIDFKLGCWYTTDSTPCPGLQVNKFGDQICKKTCHRYLEMCQLITNCGMPNAEKWIKPIQPEKCDLNAYRELQSIKDNIVDFVDNGQNLYIYSPNCGNGKTTWAIKIMYKFFDEVWSGNGFRPRAYFIFTSDYLNEMKFPSLSSDQDKLKRINKLIREVDLVIWDDIAVNELTKAEHSILLSVIDKRMQQGKSNIYTGNMLDSNLESAVGSRLFDRIQQNSKVISLVGQSRR